jgi:hypothetical protein
MSGRVGFAIGADAVTAVAVDGDVRHRFVERLPSGALEDASVLADVLRAAAAGLEAALGRAIGRARVHVALLPPLADARLVTLPPLRPQEAEAVLRRDAARHFVGGTTARVVGVAPRARRAPGPVLAAATPLALIETVRSAATAAGLRLARIVPAHAAWLTAIPTHSGRATANPAATATSTEATVRKGTSVRKKASVKDSSLRKDASDAAPGAAAADSEAAGDVVVALEGDAAHVLRTERGTLTVLRRVPAAWPDEVVAAAGSADGTAVVIGDAGARAALARALRAVGWTVDDTTDATAAETAAAHAADAGLELVPPTLAALRRMRQRTTAWRIAAAAVLLIVGAAALELWGTRRELDAVRARRAEIRDSVAPLLVARDSLSRLDHRIASIRALDTDAPRWTRALFDLALLLPPDTRLTSLHATGDTVTIEAAGARAGAALQALRDANSLTDVRLEGTVERDLEDGTTAIERFRVRARLVMPEQWKPPAVVPHDTMPRADRAADAEPADDDEPSARPRTATRRSM